MKFSYSTNEETYRGECETREDACDEAAEEIGVADHTFWVGECVPPPQPESLWDVEDWLEHVCCQDEYCGDWADGWEQSTPEQQKELESEVRKVMAAWLDRHDLRPKFWNVEKVKEYRTVDRDGVSVIGWEAKP